MKGVDYVYFFVLAAEYLRPSAVNNDCSLITKQERPTSFFDSSCNLPDVFQNSIQATTSQVFFFFLINYFDIGLIKWKKKKGTIGEGISKNQGSVVTRRDHRNILDHVIPDTV